MPYEKMNEDQIRTFLSEQPRTAKLATTRADGRPHVAPVWYVVDDDGSILFNTSSTSVKGRNLLRDPRACLCVDDERPPFTFVTLEGTVEVSEDPSELLASATRIGGRYMGEDRAEEFGKRNGVPGELLVRFRPTRATAEKDLAD